MNNWQVLEPREKVDKEELVNSLKKGFDGNFYIYTEYLNVESFIERFKNVLTEEEIKKLTDDNPDTRQL